MTQKPTVLIIGTGLIGTSIAIGLKNAGYTVFLNDADEHALAVATAKSGAQPFLDQTCDLVVVATPPRAVAGVMRAALADHQTAAVTDVSSVKATILNSLSDLGVSELARVVGGHPMAGREISGAAGAQGNLFVDRPWVLTRTTATSDDAFAQVEEMVNALGAVVIERSMDDHDQAVALISHTPQVVASVLAGELMGAEERHIELAGQGIRDTIRIASSDAGLWSEILAGNSANVAERVRNVAKRLGEMAEAIASNDHAHIVSILEQGSAGRDRLPGKHGANRASDALVLVRLDDKPGELARLFAVAAQAEVNLEDVRIDHSLGRMTGLVELTVALAAQVTLETALTSAGFVVIL